MGSSFHRFTFLNALTTFENRFVYLHQQMSLEITRVISRRFVMTMTLKLLLLLFLFQYSL